MPRTLLRLALLAACVSAGCSLRIQPSDHPRYRVPASTSATKHSLVAEADDSRRVFRYPLARTVPQVDDYSGTRVSDPYRWMEDLDSEETAAWVRAENRLTGRYLGAIPRRAALRRRLAGLWNYERTSPPVKRGKWRFFRRNDGLQDQSVLYKQRGPHGIPRVLLDPNTLSADGTVALSDTAFSEDGRYLAYSLAEAGSDWADWFVMEVETGAETGDHLSFTKFTHAAWTHDGEGFFYGRYPAPESDSLQAITQNQSLYYHRLGTSQSEDPLIYSRAEHPTWGFTPEVTPDGRWLAISGWEGTERRSRYWFVDLQDPGRRVRPLLTSFDALYEFVGNLGTTWFFRTDNGAPRGRVVAIDIEHPAQDAWREVIPESGDTLTGAYFFNGLLVADYLHDARSRIVAIDLDGAEQFAFDLPGLGTVGGMTGRYDDPEAFYSFETYTQPSAVYRIDLDSGASRVESAPEVDFDPSAYQTSQVWFTSRDGTRVPMFITHRRGLERDGNAPVLLYGYGGFNIPITPGFRVDKAVWLEMGGVYAVANIRGGGEFGREWHLAGTKERKQNVFDDFVAAAEWLIAEGWTRPSRLAIQGGSNGGLLIGACMNQRPDLYGACLPAVGVMDMLRFQRFTIGWAWVSDYGSSDDPEMFPHLYAYSPLHNVRPGVHYPATLITTADHDDRVVPSHSFKYAATLQKAQGGPAPVLIRIEIRAGHGAGKPTSKRIEEAADVLAFLARELGLDAPAY